MDTLFRNYFMIFVTFAIHRCLLTLFITFGIIAIFHANALWPRLKLVAQWRRGANDVARL